MACDGVEDGAKRPGTNPGSYYWCMEEYRSAHCPCRDPPTPPPLPACDMTGWHGRYPEGPAAGRQPCTVFGSPLECAYDGCADAQDGVGYTCSGDANDASTLFCYRQDVDDRCPAQGAYPAPNPGPSQFRGTPDCNESAALHSYGLDAHCR